LLANGGGGNFKSASIMKYHWDIRPPRPRLVFKSDRRKILRKIILPAAGLILAAAIFLGFNIFNLWKTAEESAVFIYENFQEAANRLKLFEIEKAGTVLESINQKIISLRDQVDKYGLTNFPDVKTGFSNLAQLGETMLALNKNLQELQNNGFEWLMNQKGVRLIDNLEQIRTNIQQVVQKADYFQNQSAQFNLDADIKNAEYFLEAMIDWLKSPFDQRLLVLFQNPSEIRPAGGFLGSYAVITLRQGSIISVDVRDIYDPDGQLKEKIIPPKPLQLITARWGARDANWFFDFPVSAQKTIKFLEKSDLYRENFIKFSGALAINIEVVRDIVGIIGDIDLPSYELKINENNLLEEIQREVESGQDNKAGQPKRILKVLTPILLEKIGWLDNRQKQLLIQKLFQRAVEKDIMIYFKDLAIEAYLKTLGAAGEIQNLPPDFSGDYLAVVNANIGGHKTDAFIKQNIGIESRIDAEGRITTQLTVERTHEGEQRKEWWYKKTNKNYLQIFLPIGTKLISSRGLEYKTIAAPINYEANNYIEDPDVSAIEKSRRFLEDFSAEEFRGFDRTIFAGWFSVPAGQTKKLELTYENPRQLVLRDGLNYQFIFEKQSGVKGGFQIAVSAPPGYKWRESDSAIFRYETQTPKRREIISLTLKNL
jgi:hypothetical protein